MCPSSLRPSLPPLVVLLGPTAVGKTELSLALCETLSGEVISADSRQVYLGMDIGTAKATPAERARVPHHLIDLRRPDEVLTVAEYQRLAYAAADDILRRGRTPFLVGGTALYLRAVTQGLRIPEVPPNPVLRQELEEVLAQEGVTALFRRLQSVDPAAAAIIDPANPRRVLRALEIFLITGRSKVELEGVQPPPYAILMVGLSRERGELYARIDRRVDQMIAEGLVDEVRRLLAAGYSPALPALTSLGYREVIAYLAGEMTLAEAVSRIKTETHRFVRQQMTSFRRMSGVAWFDLAASAPAEIRAHSERFLHRG